MKYSIGVDIGGTTSSMGIVNKLGDILFESEINTREYLTFETFIEACHNILLPEIEGLGQDNFKGIGIGAPNGNYRYGTIEHAPNLAWKGIVPLANAFSEKFKLEALVTNDANAAAIGEMMHGAAKGMKDFIMITLGTGVGSGIVANGGIIYGHNSFAGEIGHTIAVRDGRLCSCGLSGCLETYSSATGIVRTAHEVLADTTRKSLLRDLTTITSEDIYKAALENDEVALEIFAFTGKILGESLATAVAYTEPEAIILFGGLAQAFSFVFSKFIT